MFILKYIKTLIFNNILKVVFIILIICGFYWARSIPDGIVHTYVHSSFEDHGKYNYVVGRESSYEVKAFNEPLKIDKSGHIDYSEMPAGPILLYMVCGILSVVVLVMSFLDGDDNNWDFIEIWKDLLLEEVKCSEDCGVYNYSLHGKLLTKSDKILNSFHVSTLVGEYYQNKNIYPDYLGTKSEIRESKIKNIVTDI